MKALFLCTYLEFCTVHNPDQQMYNIYNILYIKYYSYIYRVSKKECARLREGVPYVKV